MRRVFGNKFGARKTGGYASRKEARRAAELRALEKAGAIENLREQVKFELIPTQWGECGTDLKGRPVKVCVERACSYVADFVYDIDGETVVEDTKGVRTKDYIIKRKLMLWLKGVKIREV